MPVVLISLVIMVVLLMSGEVVVFLMFVVVVVLLMLVVVVVLLMLVEVVVFGGIYFTCVSKEGLSVSPNFSISQLFSWFFENQTSIYLSLVS